MTTILKPKCAPTIYNIPGGSEVEVTLNNRQVYVGTVFINPAATSHQDSLQLLRSTNQTTDTYCRDVIHLFHNEIKHVTILKMYKPPAQRRETCMATFCVENEVQLKNLIKSLSSVTEVSVSLVGQKAGRFGTVSWLMLCIKDTLIPVDVIGLEKYGDKYVWEALRKPLFENEDIVKIVHDCRPMADYLYHFARTTLKNVFDAQVADLMIKRRNQLLGVKEFEGKKPSVKQLKASLLSECLALHIPELVLERDLALMVQYYHKEQLVDGPMMARPVPEDNSRKYAALTVKYLDALKKTMTNELMEKQIKLCDASIKIAIEANMSEAMLTIRNPEQLSLQFLKLLLLSPNVAAVQAE